MLEYTNENRDTAASKTLISYGSASYTEATLQQGQERMNYTQTLIIRISDSYGASTETNLTVQVSGLLFELSSSSPSLPQASSSASSLQLSSAS